jgi:hypothetical protein
MSPSDPLPVLELAMPHRVTHPTKEQVRAYMAAREAARRPPPAPEEIRRQLGWRLQQADEERMRAQFYLIPTSYSHMAAQITFDWMLAALRSPLALRRFR